MEGKFSSWLQSPNSEVVWPTVKLMDKLFRRGSDQSYVGHANIRAGGSTDYSCHKGSIFCLGSMFDCYVIGLQITFRS